MTPVARPGIAVATACPPRAKSHPPVDRFLSTEKFLHNPGRLLPISARTPQPPSASHDRAEFVNETMSNQLRSSRGGHDSVWGFAHGARLVELICRQEAATKTVDISIFRTVAGDVVRPALRDPSSERHRSTMSDRSWGAPGAWLRTPLIVRSRIASLVE